MTYRSRVIEAESPSIRLLAALSCVLWLGCGDDGDAADEDATSSSSAASTSDGGSATTSTSSSDATGTTESADTTAEASEGSSTTSAATQLCGIDDLAPGAANPIEASDEMPMQLPIEIGDILARSCGCHFADDLVIAGDYPPNGTLDLTTWTAWHSDFSGSPTYEAARDRLDPAIELIIMPPQTCDVGNGETMLPEDRARLLEWIAAEAPDGPTWSGM